ncbi:hypothetical protein TNIN_227561, partial [Trichonephila inaurata madagascariensis]
MNVDRTHDQQQGCHGYTFPSIGSHPTHQTILTVAKSLKAIGCATNRPHNVRSAK